MNRGETERNQIIVLVFNNDWDIYMRRRRVSPFDLYELLMCENKQHRSTDNPEESDRGEMGLVREAVGHGAENPAIIVTEALIQGELPPEYEERLQEREGYGGRWLSKRLRPKYGMLRPSRIRTVFIEIWLVGVRR